MRKPETCAKCGSIIRELKEIIFRPHVFLNATISWSGNNEYLEPRKFEGGVFLCPPCGAEILKIFGVHRT
jgi:predicted RNA-binding Zn-ribbon protein involved in translation (DUF1610 family)